MKNGWLKKLTQRPMIKAVLKSVPLVGDVMDNLDTQTVDSPQGAFNPNDMIVKIIRIVALITLAYFVLKGDVTMEAAEDVKELIK